MTKRKYIVTGGAGFIGSHLVDFLLQNGNEVLAIDNLSTGSANNVIDALEHPNFTFYTNDVRNIDFLRQVVDRNDVIIHLAATVGVEKVCENSIETAENNLRTTELLLNLSLQKQCKFLFTSTSEVYGNCAHAAKEYDFCPISVLHGGRSSYIMSKLYSEMLCLNYHEKHQLPVSIIRLFNTVGPRQSSSFGMVVPTFIQNAMRGRNIKVFDDGTQTRSFCHVHDTVEAIIALLNAANFKGEIYNIGNPTSITILELAQYIKTINNSDSAIALTELPETRNEGKDIKDRRPCIDKIVQEIGWTPKYSWQQAVEDTNRYYQSKYLSAVH